MKLAALTFILLCTARSLAAGISIGEESALPRPTNAFYSGALNMRPGNGEVVSNNPPVFTWRYSTNLARQGQDSTAGWPQDNGDKTNSFVFQVASNSTFTGTLLADVTTPMPWYNALAPFATNASRTLYWRIKYVVDETPYWTNGPYNFTIANGATNWDRSMLADTNYLATNGIHPMFCFRAGEQSSIYQWIQTNNANDYLRLTNAATAATNDTSFTNVVEWPTNSGSRNPTFATVSFDYATRINQLGSALLLWAISSDGKWTNATITGWHITNAAHLANWYLHPSNNWAMVDYGQPAGTPEAVRLLCAYYDWMYAVMGSDTGTFAGQTRTNLLLALSRTCKFYTYNNFKIGFAFPTGNLLLPYAQPGNIQVTNDVATAPDWTFPIPWYPNTNPPAPYASITNESVSWDAWTGIGTSHKSAMTYIAMPAAFVAQADDPDARFAYEWMVNYAIGRTSPYMGWAAHHIGPYGYVDPNISFRSLTSGLLVLDQMYPQLNVWRNDFCSRFPEWYSRLLPYRKRMYHGAFADGAPFGYAGYFLGIDYRGFDLAALGRSGVMRQAYELNNEFVASFDDTTSKWEQLALRWHYRVLPAAVTNSTSAVYPEDGYAIASTFSPGEYHAYTNGVGFAIRASPRYSGQGHNIPASGAPDMWAYGTQITDGGGGDGVEWPAYGHLAAGNPGLFVNGLGEDDVGFAMYGNSQTEPLHSSISHYTNSGTNFVYVCVDLTPNYVSHYHPLSNIVLSVKRHMLFVRSRYWVFFDQWATRSNATFAARWHIPWVFSHRASSSAEANETAFAGNLYGSNSLALLSNGLTYVSGNYADSAVQQTTRITNHIVFANNTNQFAIFVATGTNAISTTATNVLGTANTNSTLNPMVSNGKIYAALLIDRAAGLWITNRTASTNFTLVWALVPRENGKAPPGIERLDDNTLAVTYDGVTETNTFGTGYSGAYTYQVETANGGENPGGGGTAVRTLNAVRSTAGRVDR